MKCIYNTTLIMCPKSLPNHPALHLRTENHATSLTYPGQSTGPGLILVDKLAGRPHGPQLSQEATVIATVQISKHGLEGKGGLLSIIKGNATVRARLAWVATNDQKRTTYGKRW
jgi:hypothetical protein